MSTSPIITSNTTLNTNKTQEPPTNQTKLNPTTNDEPQQLTTISEIPIIHHHHQQQHEGAMTSVEGATGSASASSTLQQQHHETTQQVTPTTTMVSVITEESEESRDPLRNDFGHKSFYHLQALNDESLDKYCNHYGESIEGNKHAKLARLMTHFPNFNRKGMERFVLESLKEMCLELGLSTEGKKSFLIDRLFNLYLEKHKEDKLEFTFDTAKHSPEVATTDVSLHHHNIVDDEEEEEEEAVNPKTGEPFRKSPRVAKRKQTEKEASSKKSKSDDSITREYFMKHGDDIKFNVDGKDHTASKKSETHNSFGWHYSGRSKIEVGSYTVPVTVTLNVTVNKSGRKEEGSDEE